MNTNKEHEKAIEELRLKRKAEHREHMKKMLDKAQQQLADLKDNKKGQESE